MPGKINLRNIHDQNELVYLSGALEAVVFVLASHLFEHGRALSIADSLKDFAGFRQQLLADDAMEMINRRLDRFHGPQQLEKYLDSYRINEASSVVDKVLSEELKRKETIHGLVDSFARGSALLIVKMQKTDLINKWQTTRAWWCEIYGLNKILPC